MDVAPIWAVRGSIPRLCALIIKQKDMETLTPAQDYAYRVICAIEQGNLVDAQTIILERPETLKSALSAYLSKSKKQRAYALCESAKQYKRVMRSTY